MIMYDLHTAIDVKLTFMLQTNNTLPNLISYDNVISMLTSRLQITRGSE